MHKSSEDREHRAAPPCCYQVLSHAEFLSRVGRQRAALRFSSPDPFTIPMGISGQDGFPAFQLEDNVNVQALDHLKEIYTQANVSNQFLWDFLRTRHSDLGGLTGVDFLLGYFDAEMSSMREEARMETFLDLAREDMGSIGI